ncbi:MULTISPECIES: inorganic phosphate transporter [Nitrospira]|uniref:Phosphate transporter n=2 Tax=Nitrospira TaxID=1234 RepID=A0AA86MZ65_9BACT|nr:MULTISPECIES: inorganic phosphate transporter [Nitrospira]CAE6731012.1 Phosphate transporter [Nitrospira defluvii]CAI4031762.1 Phosphate transporter [Nitrospira tepida]
MELSILTFVLVLSLACANGANDVSKAIATLVGSGVTNYRTAILWGTLWTMIGAGLSGLVATAMVKTFSQGLLAPDAPASPPIAAAVLIGAVLWVLAASWSGLPVSTTHALTGAIVGVGLVAFGSEGLLWKGIGRKIVLPLILSPVLALMVSVIVHRLVRTLAARWEGACVCVMPTARALVMIDAQGATRTLFQTAALGRPVVAVPVQCDRAGLSGLVVGLDSIHWCSSGLASLARGTNDAPKIAAILLLGSAVATWPSAAYQGVALIGVAMAMGVGSYLAGLRVTQVLAEKVTRMDHGEGLSANLTTSSLVMVSAVMGLPVSTTHVSSSAIIGIGLLKGVSAVRWSTVRDMVLAWVVTLPASGLLSALAYHLLTRLV